MPKLLVAFLVAGVLTALGLSAWALRNTAVPEPEPELEAVPESAAPARAEGTERNGRSSHCSPTGSTGWPNGWPRWRDGVLPGPPRARPRSQRWRRLPRRPISMGCNRRSPP
jgi:hypothetical protein